MRKLIDFDDDIINLVNHYAKENRFGTNFTRAVQHIVATHPDIKNLTAPPRPKFTFDHAVSCLLVRKTKHGKTREAIDPYFLNLLTEAEAHYSEEEIKEMIMQHYAHREKTWEELLEA
jgi:hypothetical protein